MQPDPDAPAVTRNYSLCGPPGGPHYRIGVKNEHGLASGFIHRSVRAGSRVEVGAPRGSFMLADGVTPIVLISAGVGVTPMLGMLHAAAAGRRLGRFGGCMRRATGRIMRLRGKRTSCLRCSLHPRRCVVYSRPAAEDMSGRDFDRPGRLSPALLQDIGVPQDADFYLCGPPELP